MRKCKLTSSRMYLKEFSKANTDFLTLFGIYKDTIDPTMDYDKFLFLYLSEKLVAIDFTLFTLNGRRAGFSAAFFYSTKLNGKSTFVARSATGLYEEFQGKGLHDICDLYLKFVRFALSHPTRQLYVAAFVINPFVFSELCRFVPRFFPKPNIEVPGKIQSVIAEMAGGHNRWPDCPHSFEVPIQVKFNEKLLKRIYQSKNESIAWYLEQNPGFLDKFGLLVIVEVSWKNIAGTVLNLVKYFFPRKKRAVIQEYNRRISIIKQKIINLFRGFDKWNF